MYIIVDNNGKPKMEKVDPAIISLLHNLRNGDQLSLFDAVKAIRMSLVPEGYEPCPFPSGVPEGLEDMLKSNVDSGVPSLSLKVYTCEIIFTSRRLMQSLVSIP